MSGLPDPRTAAALAHDRAGDVESQTAALASPKVGSLNSAVLDLMGKNPEGLTATETLDLYVAEHRVTGLYSVAPRLSQLERMGWLEKAGTRTRAGERRRTVYRLTSDASLQMLRERLAAAS